MGLITKDVGARNGVIDIWGCAYILAFLLSMLVGREIERFQ
jgi:hypothetical protein